MPAIVEGFDAAVFKSAAEDYSVQRVGLSELGVDDVLVKIAGCGLCHTDLAVAAFAGDAFAPAIFGHEGAGVVVAVGVGVTDLTEGDHVVLSYDSCGVCRACAEGKRYFCQRFQELNTSPARRRTTGRLTSDDGTEIYSGFFGQSAFAEYAVASSRNAVRIADDVPLELAGPLGCGLATGAGAILNALAVRPGQSVAVFGVGAVGLSAIMAARICNAAAIIAVDRHPARLEMAAQLGATILVNTAEVDPVERIGAELGEVDVTFDTTGVTELMSAAVAVLPAGGVCGLVAIGGRIELDPFAFVLGRTVMGIVEGNSNPHQLIPQLLEWWRSGLYPFDALVKTYPLAEINLAVRQATDGEVIKPVLVP